MGVAEGFDCTDVTVQYTDVFVEDECGDPIANVERTWKATDLSGNQTSATQTISIARGIVCRALFRVLSPRAPSSRDVIGVST